MPLLKNFVKLNRINAPTWARAARVDKEGISSEGLTLLRASREALVSAVEAEVSRYISDPRLVFASDDDFPSALRLNGDFYLGDEFYSDGPAKGVYRISIAVRFLAHPIPPRDVPDDYLGLEVWLEYDSVGGTFSPFRNSDSFAI